MVQKKSKQQFYKDEKGWKDKRSILWNESPSLAATGFKRIQGFPRRLNKTIEAHASLNSGSGCCSTYVIQALFTSHSGCMVKQT